MLNFERNKLRIGHRVVVHNRLGSEFPVLVGAVAFVETRRSKRGANGGGVRVVADGGGHRVVWPSYLAAHHDPPDPSEACWRCTARADAAARQPIVPALAAPIAAR